jgi:hypothetical protein
MLELLSALEESAFGQLLRSLGVWTYGILNLSHIAGVSSLFGSVLLLDLRLLGLWPGLPLAALTGPTLRLATIGFVVAAGSGFCMLSFNASEYYGNPFLLIKFPAIALGLINAAVVSRLPAWRSIGQRDLMVGERRQLALTGGLSLLCWTTALAAGRMIGYW